MERGKTYYYSDELNDDFAGNSIEGLKIGRDYSFAPDGVLWRICEFIVYYLIAIPAVFVICFVFSGFSIKNRKAVSRLRRARKERGGKGFFIYANHTHWLDAFIAPLVCFPQKAHVITSPDAVSIKGLGVIVKMLGAIPIPTERDAIPLFVEAVSKRIAMGRSVMIFPEAHIWPYCTFVRDFKVGSFRYPLKEEVPVVAVCTTYTRRRGLFAFRKSPKRNVFVSEPFYPEGGMPMPAAKQKLRDGVYVWLRDKAAENSDYEYVHYEKTAESNS